MPHASRVHALSDGERADHLVLQCALLCRRVGVGVLYCPALRVHTTLHCTRRRRRASRRAPSGSGSTSRSFSNDRSFRPAGAARAGGMHGSQSDYEQFTIRIIEFFLKRGFSFRNDLFDEIRHFGLVDPSSDGWST